MKPPCPNYIERLVSLAEGQSEREAEAHVAACEPCEFALAQYKSILASAAYAAVQVPAELSARVASLVTPKRRFAVATLLRSSAFAGARALPSDLQVLVEGGGHRFRLMYARQGSGWEVLGQAPSSNWRAETAVGEVLPDSVGRFGFVVPGLESTGFRLVGEDLELEVTPLEVLLLNGTPTSH